MAESYESRKISYLNHFKDAKEKSSGRLEEIKTTPTFSLKVKYVVDLDNQKIKGLDKQFEKISLSGSDTDGTTSSGDESSGSSANVAEVLPQYSLLGFNIDENPLIGDNEPILMNTRAPNSFFLCGSQGSGKSYTLSCMLENSLLSHPGLGPTSSPVAGIVFHYDVDSSASLAEAASLCSAGIKVNVLVSRSNYTKLSAEYKKLKGATKNLTVNRLLLKNSHLDIDRLHKLMAVSDGDKGVPLYMEIINQILRDFAINNTKLTWTKFMNEIEMAGLDRKQNSMLDQRMKLLMSFMEECVTQSERPPRKLDMFCTQPGKLTIVDLSDPLIDSASACVLFDICLGLFKQNRPQAGLIVAIDEAHKYMTSSLGASNFTERLLTTIREQRHNATRIVIATQEPTISDKLLDLCSVSIVHRFSSPAWFESIKRHLGGASSLVCSRDQQKEMLDKIVKLNVGESFVFSPSSYVCYSEEDRKEQKLGSGFMKMKTRERLTLDSGRSKMAG